MFYICIMLIFPRAHTKFFVYNTLIWFLGSRAGVTDLLTYSHRRRQSSNA